MNKGSIVLFQFKSLLIKFSSKLVADKLNIWSPKLLFFANEASNDFQISFLVNLWGENTLKNHFMEFSISWQWYRRINQVPEFQ